MWRIGYVDKNISTSKRPFTTFFFLRRHPRRPVLRTLKNFKQIPIGNFCTGGTLKNFKSFPIGISPCVCLRCIGMALRNFKKFPYKDFIPVCEFAPCAGMTLRNFKTFPYRDFALCVGSCPVLGRL